MSTPPDYTTSSLGYRAGYSNTFGNYNDFFGYGAGIYNTTGSNNVYIANGGPSAGTESNTIRNRHTGHRQWPDRTYVYIAGIYGSTVRGSGIPVYVDNNGQLGTVLHPCASRSRCAIWATAPTR